MTLDIFQLLSPRAQLLHVLTTGTLLSLRWEDAGAITIYHLSDGTHGFCAELCYNSLTQATEVLRSFLSGLPLEEYAHNALLLAAK